MQLQLSSTLFHFIQRKSLILPVLSTLLQSFLYFIQRSISESDKEEINVLSLILFGVVLA